MKYNRSFVTSLFVLLIFLFLAKLSAQAPQTFREEKAGQNQRWLARYDELPLSFEANKGQTDPRVKFSSREPGQTLFLTADDAVLVLSRPPKRATRLQESSVNPAPSTSPSSVVRMKLLGANQNAEVTGLERLPGSTNYFIGNDPAKWRTSVPTYAKVRYGQIYPGVDLVYYGNRRELEYDFVIEPGADSGRIRLAIQGAMRISFDADGDAVLHCKGGDIRLEKPRIYQEVDGQKIEVAGGYELKGHELRFAVAPYDHSQALVIDPVLSYATYLGGSGIDSASAIAVDSSGNAYVTGESNSPNFPGIGAGSFQSSNGGNLLIYVAKLNPSGSAVLYATYLGSSSSDAPTAIAVDSAGNAYVTGYTRSTTFPVNNALQPSNGGGYDAFVTKLNSTGSALLYSTYLGGSNDDRANGIALDASGNAYLAGATGSFNFPGVNASSAQSNAGGAFVAELNAAGSALSYATYLGGSRDYANGVAVDSSGNAYVVGNVQSLQFPVTPNGVQPSFGGGPGDAFVTKVNATGTAFSYSTYLGGSGYDTGLAIAADNQGNAYVTGYTNSLNFPGVTANSIQPANDGNYDTYVAKLDTVNGGITYATYLGTSTGTGIAIDSSGNAYVTGSTSSTTFPGVTAASPQPQNGGAGDAFVARLNATATALTFSTYLGGSANDNATGIALDPSGNAYVTGNTNSPNFPVTANPAVASLPAGLHGFVAMFSFAAGARAPSNVGLSSSANPSAQGQLVTFTAVASGSGGTPSGTVDFLDGGTKIGSAQLSNGQASFGISSLSPGPHSITASYSGDDNFTPRTSAILVQTVRAFASTTAIASSVSPAGFAQLVTFTATVTAAGAGAPAPTGNVIFNDGPQQLAVQALVSGTVAFSTASLTAGPHAITATYVGDANFAPSTSAPLAQMVNWPPPLQGPPSTAAIRVGNNPAAMTVNPFTDRIYVANRASNSVSVIDAGTNSVIATVAVGQAPVAVAVNTQTNMIYTADRDSGTVTVIDGASSTVAATVSLVQMIGQIQFGSSPLAVAVDERNNQIYVGPAGTGFAAIDGATKTVNFLESLGGAISFAKSPLTDREYVGFSDDSTIEGYEGSTDLVLCCGGSGFIRPVGLAVDPAAVKAYAADEAGGLDVINEIANTFTISPVGNVSLTLNANVPGGTHQISVSGSFSGDLGVTYASTGVALTSVSAPVIFQTTVTAPPPVNGQPPAQSNPVVINGVGQDAGVVDANTGQPLQRVNSVSSENITIMIYSVSIDGNGVATYVFGRNDAGRKVNIFYYAAPQQGQYRVSRFGSYTFAAADVGAAIVITYNAANLPYALAVDALDNAVYVANQSAVAGQNATVTVSNADSGATFASVPVGQTAVPVQIPAPNKIAVDEAVDFIYVANDASNDVTLIDGSTVHAVTNVSVGASPSALLRDPFSCSIYVANAGSGTVSVITRTSSGPDICISSTMLSFGSQPVGTTSGVKSVVVTNIGNADLQISGVEASGDFAVAGNGLPAPPNMIVLHPGQRFTIQVTFTPTAFGPRIGQITLTDNAASSPQLVTLAGDGAAPVNVQLTVNPNPVVYGQFPTLTAVVAPQAQGQPIPTGSVTFLLDGRTKVGIQQLDATGSATLNFPSIPFQFPAGSPHTLTARYNGDINFAVGTSPAANLIITKAQTFASADLVLNTTPQGLEVFVDAVSPGNGTPTGTVNLQDGQTTFTSIILDANASGTAPLALPPGLHHVTAQYVGDQNFLGSASQPTTVLVVAPTTTALKSGAPTVAAGSGVTFTATVTGHPPITGIAVSGTIIFRDGQTEIYRASTVGKTGSVTTQVIATGPSGVLAVGQHMITAEYQDGTGDYQGSTSAPLTETVQPASGGGGGGGGCNCTKTGNYKAPAAPFKGAMDPLSSSSPNGKYTVTVIPATLGPGQDYTDIAIYPAGSQRPLLDLGTQPNTTHWFFSPDEDRFVMHYTQPVPGQQGQVDDYYYVYDLKPTPARRIVGTYASVQSSRLEFSPSGRYFTYTAVEGNQQTEIFIYRVQGVSQQDEPPLYDSTPFLFTVAPGTTFGDPNNPEKEDDNTGGVGWGFSPDKPETSFVYAYVTGDGIFQWVLVNLAAGHAVRSNTYGGAGAPAISAFWEFDPCADVAAIVWQLNGTQEEVEWYDTSTGEQLPGSGFPIDLTNLTLETTSTGQEQAIDSSGQVQAQSQGRCGQPNTPTGQNIKVQPTDSGSTTAPVDVTFSNVTTAGQTTVTSTTTAPSPATPNDFKLGTPATYYDVTTTAVNSPPPTPPTFIVCIHYSGFHYTNPSAIKLSHFDTTLNPPAWTTLTTSNNPTTTTVNNIPPMTACGTSNSLSPFGLVEPAGPVPASLTATGGTPQSATVGTVFAAPLQATVTDSNGSPISGIPVTFEPPAAGATGNFSGATLASVTTDASGVATAPAFMANGTTGGYTVTASVEEVATPAVFSLTNTQSTVPVPNVVGLTQADAATAITDAGLTVGTVTQQASSTVPSGDVISESPTAGTAVNLASAVNLVISSGPSCALNISATGQVQAKLGIRGLVNRTGTFAQQIILSNNGNVPIAGPIYILVENLSGANISGPSGVTSCNAPLGTPFVVFPGGLGIGATTETITLVKTGGNTGVTFTPEVLAGVGTP